MNPEIKARWVAALRSGEYKKTTGKLRAKGGFCCLGVLCNLHAQDHPEIAAKQKKKGEYMGQAELLPWTVRDWAGLSSSGGGQVRIDGCRDTLANHNDNGVSFKQLADAIEEQL